MKVCPVCQTTLFEDMEVCYGCLYHFGSEPALEKAANELADDRRPQNADFRRWAVRLEVRSQSDPDQVWVAELIPPYEDGGSADMAAPAAVEPHRPTPGAARATPRDAAVSA